LLDPDEDCRIEGDLPADVVITAAGKLYTPGDLPAELGVEAGVRGLSGRAVSVLTDRGEVSAGLPVPLDVLRLIATTVGTALSFNGAAFIVRVAVFEAEDNVRFSRDASAFLSFFALAISF
jgi:hypothetical protein